MNQVTVMNSATASALANAISAEVVLKGKWKKASDLLISSGITTAMLVKPAKGEVNPNEKLHDQINATIVSTFNKHVQSCLAKEMKVLSEVDRETKRYWTKQISSLFNKVRTHLETAEKLADDESKGIIAPRVTVTKVQRAKNSLQEGINILKSLEKPDFDVVKMISDLKTMIATIK